METRVVTAEIEAENTFTDPLRSADYHKGVRYSHVNVTIWGTWDASVTLQKSFDGGTTWHDVQVWVANEMTHSFSDTELGMLYRVGVKTGEYVSGKVMIRMSK